MHADALTLATEADKPTIIRMISLAFGGPLAGFGGVGFFYMGIAGGSISVVKPIAYTLAPAIAAVLGALWLKEAMPAQKVLGIALTLAGVVLIATSHGVAAPGGDSIGPAQGAGAGQP